MRGPFLRRGSRLPSKGTFSLGRRLSLETLEDRTLLSVTVNHTPYLQLGDAALVGFDGGQDQIEIWWQTIPDAGGTTDTFTVEYSPAGAGTWTGVPENSVLDTGVGGRVNHSATITGLPFDDDFDYRVIHLKDAVPFATYDGEIHTRLAPSDATPFTFVAYGDSAAANPPTEFIAVQTQINALDPAFSLLLGDNVYSFGTHDEFDFRLDPTINPALTDYIRDHIDYYAVGNHDESTDSGQPSRDNYSVPVPVADVTSPTGIAFDSDVETEENYSFDYGDVHFLTLDSNNWQEPSVLDKQLDWAVADLLASDARWKIVFVHHPLASLAGHPENNPTKYYYQQMVERLGINGAAGAGADLIFTGHAHNYQRSYPLTGESGGEATFVLDTDNNYSKGKGVVQVIAGAGGQIAGYGADNDAFADSYVAVGLDTNTTPNALVHGFAKVDVTHDVLTVSFVDKFGNVLDTFTITAQTDVARPVARLAVPQDQAADDLSPIPGIVSIDTAISTLVVQLADFGDGIDDATVTSDTVALSGVGGPLTPGVDYTFHYDTVTNRITLSLVSDVFDADNYLIDLNTGVSKIEDRAGNELSPTTLPVVVATSPTTATEEFLPFSTTWKYLDDGSDQGTAWIAPAFDDSTWATGPGQLGYGDNDETTVVSFGGDPENKHITTYFRQSFDIADVGDYTSLGLSLLSDDGVVVYLNGTEIYRNNLPVGPVTSSSLASSSLSGIDDFLLKSATASSSLLVNGTNVIAVEIHQAAVDDPDLSFMLRLGGVPNMPPDYVSAGGPYSVDEGGMVTFVGSATDPDPLDTLTYSWDINDDGTFGDAVGEMPALDWSQLLALGINDGPSAVNIYVRADDGHGHVITSPAAVLTVNNSPPTAIIDGPSTGVTGVSVDFTLSATDPSPVDEAATFTFDVDWDGDMTVDETVMDVPSGTIVPHVFLSGGPQTARVTVTDRDGDTSTEATHVISLDVPPQIIDVLVKGSAWDSGFLSALDTNGLGFDGYSIPDGSGDQLDALTWSNITQIRILFSEQVTIVKEDLTVAGVNSAEYVPFFLTIEGGPIPGSFLATWTFTTPLPNDKLLLHLGDSIIDLAGNPLDGEWDNPVNQADPSSDTYPSGDMVPGGDFDFRLNLLRGDANHNGNVNLGDFTVWGDNFGLPFTPGVEQADFNANGDVGIDDFTIWGDNYNISLPAGEPSLPGGDADSPFADGGGGGGALATENVFLENSVTKSRSRFTTRDSRSRVVEPPTQRQLIDRFFADPKFDWFLHNFLKSLTDKGAEETFAPPDRLRR